METIPTNENLKKFIYRDNFKNREIVFECFAKDILEADKLFEEMTGLNIVKNSNIACEIINNEND